MKNILITLAVFCAFALSAQNTFAQNYYDTYYYNGGGTPTYTNSYTQPNDSYVNYLLDLISQLRLQLQNQQTSSYSYAPYNNYYDNYSNNYPRSNYYDSSLPQAETDRARDVDEDSAELNGSVDMNDEKNGIVFFVYGQDEDAINDVERDYDEYRDVEDDQEDDDFEVVRVDRDLDGDEDYEKKVSRLEDDEWYYFTICVEYEYNNRDERIVCGEVRDFETER